MTPVRELDFFMDPSEQLELLSSLISLNATSLILSFESEGYRNVSSDPAAAVAPYLQIDNLRKGCQLFLRSSRLEGTFVFTRLVDNDITEPDLDLLASQAVLLQPSVIFDERYLLHGLISIPSISRYREMGISPDPAVKLHRMLSSLIRKVCPYSIAITGKDKKEAGMVASVGARELASRGLILRQAPIFRTTFEIVDASV